MTIPHDEDRPTDTGESAWFRRPSPTPDVDARRRETERVAARMWSALLVLAAVAVLVPLCLLMGWLP